MYFELLINQCNFGGKKKDRFRRLNSNIIFHFSLFRSFNVIGMACIWDILGWAVSFVRPSLPIGFLSYLLTALTITTVMSEMSFVGVPGTFLALLLSSLCAVMCGFMCILALLGTVVGLLAGFVAAAGGEMPEGFWSFEMN